MSLPDTVFIFVLALIIFGPKKLPEIGRQLGRLVGEFRRASNEFKFQIEEELRQADWNDQKPARQTIAPPNAEAPAPAPVSLESDALPAGQRPNIDAIDVSNLTATNKVLGPVGDDAPVLAAPYKAEDLVVSPAEGSEPREGHAFAHTGTGESALLHETEDMNSEQAELFASIAPEETLRTVAAGTHLRSESSPIAPAVAGADFTHG